MHYTEYTPSQHLREYVDCYWLHRLEGGVDNYREQSCLPLGTVELIIQTDEHHSHHLLTKGAWEKSMRAFFAGFYEHPVVWKAGAGSVMFGIRLKPESLMRLFRFPAAELVNIVADAEAILGGWLAQMGDEMCGVTDSTRLVDIAERYLIVKLLVAEDNQNRFVSACRLLRQHPADFTIDRLSAELSVSKRQMERIFRDQLGITPKTYQRIVRFAHAYNHVVQNNRTVWTDISYDNGYADQSHFIRDFKVFTGSVPTEFISKTQPFSPKTLSVNTVLL